MSPRGSEGQAVIKSIRVFAFTLRNELRQQSVPSDDGYNCRVFAGTFEKCNYGDIAALPYDAKANVGC